MAEPLVGIGEHRVRGLAHERVAKPQLFLAWKPRRTAACDQLALHELIEPHVRRVMAIGADELDHAVAPEPLAEHARGAQHVARVELESLEPALHRGEHGLGQRIALAFGRRADQLFEIERVATGLLDDPRDQRVARVLEHAAHEPLAALLGQLVEPQLVQAALGPQPREPLVHFGPREREHEQRPIVQRAQRSIDELDARHVAPVQVLEHDREWRYRRLDRNEMFERAPDLLGHDQRIDARGGERRHNVRLGLERRADQLAEKRDRRGRLGRHVAHHARAQLVAADIERLAVLDAGGAAQRRRDDPVRRARAQRIAATEPELERLAAIGDLVTELVTHARLADARRAGDQHRARHRLGDTLVIEPDQHAELAVAPDTWRRLAQQRARARPYVVLGDDVETLRIAADLEARVEQPRGHVVDAHAEAVGIEQLRRAIDRFADRPAPGHHGSPGRQRDRRGRRDDFERERAPRRRGRLIRGRPAAGDGDDMRAIDQALEHAAVLLRDAA